MPPPPAPTTEAASDVAQVAAPTLARRDSSSQRSDDSQTAADILRDQVQLEADAREALPYSIEHCTKDLGPLRQNIFSCLTCNPAPANPSEPYAGAGICYACSVQCHGEHQLVEIFTKRGFTCDCGTTRLPSTSPCTLRLNPVTKSRGIHSEQANSNNKYNQNFRNRFCACERDYDPFQQTGTMFQCLGLGSHDDGGCGEDWYHPGCIMGIGPDWYNEAEGTKALKSVATAGEALPAIAEDAEAPADAPEQTSDDNDQPNPLGFPDDDDFDTFLCFKCVEANAWIKRYAGTPVFLLPVYRKSGSSVQQDPLCDDSAAGSASRKRKAEDEAAGASQDSKRLKDEPKDSVSVIEETHAEEVKPAATCKYDSLPYAPKGTLSLFCTEEFRDRFCRCARCYPYLSMHAQLLEEEDTYEPPVSEEGSEHGGSTHGSGSLYERGESALRNVDRVRAIEGVMAYNKLKSDLQPFFQQFAESGKAISAEDIKEYFAKLRGDEDAIKEAGGSARSDNRREQPGY